MIPIIAGLLALGAVLLPATGVSSQAQAPAVNAEKVVILSDYNEVLYQVGANDRLGPASLTKMMTAITAMRYGSLDQQIVVDEHDLVGEATMGLQLGDVLTVGDALYGLLLPSGNDAAMAIARTIGAHPADTDPQQSVDRFVGYMNTVTRQLQLRNTHFMNPHGLDQPGHYSTAYDMALILRSALNYPEIRERMQTVSYRVANTYDLYNGHQLLQERSDYIGGKTGFTDDCGFCLASAARQGDRMAIVVIMRDDWNWFWDSSLLLDYAFELMEERGIPDWADPQLAGTQLLQPRP